MCESHIKVFWCIAILNLSFLLPRCAFAHTTELFDGLIFIYPVLIPVFNLIKAIIIKLIIMRQNSNIHFGKTLLGVTMVEIFLFFLCYPLTIMVRDTLFYPDISFDSELTEMYWVFIVIISYGVLSIIPNFFLVKKINLQLEETISDSTKIIYASMLALIMPAALILLLFLKN